MNPTAIGMFSVNTTFITQHLENNLLTLALTPRPATQHCHLVINRMECIFVHATSKTDLLLWTFTSSPPCPQYSVTICSQYIISLFVFFFKILLLLLQTIMPVAINTISFFLPPNSSVYVSH